MTMNVWIDKKVAKKSGGVVELSFFGVDCNKGVLKK